MVEDLLQQCVIQSKMDELLSSDAAQKLAQAVEVVTMVQKGLYAFISNEDGSLLNLLKIGSVFQIFFIDTLASGKKPKDLTTDDWDNIVQKVYQYAVIEDNQRYSEFVFTLYADYIDISADMLKNIIGKNRISDEQYTAIKDIAATIRNNTELLRDDELRETDYIEEGLWLSLEGTLKILSSALVTVIGSEFTELTQAVTQLAFEYGRYVLFSKEQALLEKYIEQQYVLDEDLKRQYENYLAEVEKEAERFGSLIDNAFTLDIRQSLIQSAELARAAGISDDNLMLTIEDVDDFFR